MGYERNHAIVVSDCGYGDFIEKAQAKALVLLLPTTAIVLGDVNDIRSFAVLPDGSKEGWSESDAGDARRAEFVAFLRSQYYEDGSSPLKWAEVQYGDDERETKTLASSDDDRRAHSIAEA